MGLNHPSKKLVQHICEILNQSYPDSRLGNKKNPLDEYLYIILSLRTHERGVIKAYRGFKSRFKSWSEVEGASIAEIEEVIWSGGLASQKGKRISGAVRYIKNDLGEVSLRSLKSLSQDQAEAFLLGLPGVGLKTARCIMMYSLGFQVLPVDTHVSRITNRLGWVCLGSVKYLHSQLDNIIPANLRFCFHVRCVQHGRKICRGQLPQCDICCLTEYCQYRYKKT